jgi:UDP-glucose 4-epimerase
MVYVGNLVDLIWRCTWHPGAAGQTLLVSDGQDISTAQLIHYLARAMHQADRLWPCPVAVLNWGARLTGRQAALERLLGSLQVDIQATRQTLSWQPPFSVEAGMAATVAAMLASS